MSVRRIHRFLMKNTLLLVILAAILFITAAIVVASFSKQQGGQNNDYNQLEGSGLAVINNRITDLMTGVSTEEARSKALFEFTESSKLIHEENNYFLQTEKGRQQINKEYPLLIDNGAFYYLYHSEFILITDSFEKIAATPSTYLSEGKVFNQQKHREGDKNILLLGLPNGYYMNSQKIDILNGDTTESIEINSIIQFGENQISYCNIHDNKLKLYKIELKDTMSKVELKDTDLSYNAFYNHLISDNTIDSLDSQALDKVVLNSDIYQYFIENRYEYLGNKNFYYTDQGYFMENADERFLLESAPMYFAEGEKLLLPSDYVLVQPGKYQMNKLSAMTEIFYQSELVYTTTGEEKRTYRDIVLFDGQDTYLFFNDTEISWEEESITVTPLSSVTVAADGKLEVYNYAVAEYRTYQLEGYQEVRATINNNIKFNLSQDILYRPDGQEQILFSEPSLLRNAE